MSTKYVITFSNQTEHGIEEPEKIFNQTVIEHVTSIISRAARKNGFDLDNCTAYSVQGMYKGSTESSFRLEYITHTPAAYMKGIALWLKDKYEQESVLLENNIKVIYLEDFAKSLSLKTKISGLVHYLKRDIPQVLAEDAAVILFTSGTDAMPKAVVLSHKNLEANRFQLLSMLSINTSDIFFNALPMFHSFGLTLGGVIAPLSGVKVFLYPSPLHYRIVPELVYDTNATIICGTDTFFFGYGRLGHPYDFFNLKYTLFT